MVAGFVWLVGAGGMTRGCGGRADPCLGTGCHNLGRNGESQGWCGFQHGESRVGKWRKLLGSGGTPRVLRARGFHVFLGGG